MMLPTVWEEERMPQSMERSLSRHHWVSSLEAGSQAMPCMYPAQAHRQHCMESQPIMPSKARLQTTVAARHIDSSRLGSM